MKFIKINSVLVNLTHVLSILLIRNRITVSYNNYTSMATEIDCETQEEAEAIFKEIFKIIEGLQYD